jgi:putative aldouronate transport system substrate-binding protein
MNAKNGSMIVGLGALALCVGALGVQAQSTLPPVELRYTYPGVVPKDVAKIQDAINAYIKPKINATIKLEPIDWGAFDQKMNLGFAAGERCDLVFTAPWINDFYRNSRQGNFATLDTLLPKYAPRLYRSMSKAVWETAKVNGKISAVINQQNFANRAGLFLRRDLVSKYKLDTSKIGSIDDIADFLMAVKKGEPGITPLLSDDQFYGTLIAEKLLDLDTISVLGAVGHNDKAAKIFSPYDTPQYKRLLEVQRKFYQSGFYTTNPLSGSDAISAMKDGKYAGFVHFIKPGGASERKAQFGFDFIEIPLAKAILTTGSVTATLNAVCQSSPNPERSLMFLELLNTDRTVYNLLAKGIEGQHWAWADRSKRLIGFPQGVTAESSGYNPNTDWMFGNQFNAYYVTPSQIGAWESSRRSNQSATPSVLLGFVFDPTAVKTEIAQISAVLKEKASPLERGNADVDKGLTELQAALKQAGQDRLIAEEQRQVNAWLASKK